MKDEVYNQFKKDVAKYHRKGYSMNYPSIEEFDDREHQEGGYFIQLTMSRKTKTEKLPK